MSRLLVSRRLQLSISRSNSISHGRKVLRCMLPRSSSWMRRLNCAKTASLSGRSCIRLEFRDKPTVLIVLIASNVNTLKQSVHPAQPAVDGGKLFADLVAIWRFGLEGQVFFQIDPGIVVAMQLQQ